jgi:hypothetical protein
MAKIKRTKEEQSLMLRSLDNVLKFIGLSSTRLSGLDFNKEIHVHVLLKGGKYEMTVRAEKDNDSPLTDDQTYYTATAILSVFLHGLITTRVGKDLVKPLK